MNYYWRGIAIDLFALMGDGFYKEFPSLSALILWCAENGNINPIKCRRTKHRECENCWHQRMKNCRETSLCSMYKA